MEYLVKASLVSIRLTGFFTACHMVAANIFNRLDGYGIPAVGKKELIRNFRLKLRKLINARANRADAIGNILQPYKSHFYRETTTTPHGVRQKLRKAPTSICLSYVITNECEGLLFHPASPDFLDLLVHEAEYGRESLLQQYNTAQILINGSRAPQNKTLANFASRRSGKIMNLPDPFTEEELCYAISILCVDPMDINGASMTNPLSDAEIEEAIARRRAEELELSRRYGEV